MIRGPKSLVVADADVLPAMRLPRIGGLAMLEESEDRSGETMMARLQCIRCAKYLTTKDAYVLPKRRQHMARNQEDPVVCAKHFEDATGNPPRSGDTLWIQKHNTSRTGKRW
ncbi:hypothetical protein [Mycolicibacterium thermoresistibile]